MKSPSGRGRANVKEREDLERISSPNARIVSGRRVNREKEPLLRQGDSEPTTASCSHLKPGRRPIDAEMLSLRSHPGESSSLMDHSYSIDTPFMRGGEGRLKHQGSLISEYTPALRHHLPPWSVLLPYYLPILSWVHEYSLSHFVGDLIGGVSLASFQIPLAISYSISLAKLPITCGLYSLGISPLIYCVFGSVPQMIVGPEAPISLIVGQAVEPLLHHAKKKNIDPVVYICAITLVSGATLLGFGIARFGFLDNVLCESLLKGFICGVGIVMVINSSISMLGLNGIMEDVIKDSDDMDIHSPFDKVRFLMYHYHESHPLTMRVSFIAFFIVIALRYSKSRASKSPRWRYTIYIPEILIVVLASTILCYKYRWNHRGLEIVGSLEDVTDPLKLYHPFSKKMWPLVRHLASSGFTCAMLGFFESTTASKSLGSRYDLPISSNRELVALGAINVAGSFVGALPAFGGYGRSKVNAISAKTTVSGAIMGIIALCTVGSVLEYLHYIPKSALSVVTAAIGISLITETPQELYFHWISKGYDELITFFITVLTTLFFSMEAGIAVGLIYSLLRVIRNSAESRIQILGRVPGTNTFLDADLHLQAYEEGIEEYTDDQSKGIPQLNLFTDNFRPLNYQALEEIEGCLIIRIPEPLTFTNASDLRARLKRVEMYGSVKAHPALKRSRDMSMTKYMIFDLEDMIYIDSSAANILKTWLVAHQKKGIKSFFVRVTKTPKLRKRLKNTGIKDILAQDLESIRYGEIQERAMALTQTPTFESNVEEFSISENEAEEIRPVTEKAGSPYFDHIRSALKLIDAYELLEQSSLEGV